MHIFFRLLAVSKNEGGIEDRKARVCFSMLLSHLVHSACLEEWTRHVSLDGSARPWQVQAACKGDITLSVGLGGRLQFLEEFQQEQPKHWQKYVNDLGFDGASMALETYLHALGGSKAGGPLFQQMVCILGRRLDKLLTRPVLPAASDKPPLQLKRTSSSPMQTDLALESKLMVHLDRCKAACGDLLHFSVAADKSRVGSRAIQNAVGCLPNNVAFAMPPQVVMAKLEYVSKQFANSVRKLSVGAVRK